ncbi:MAG: recombinase family protein, partial [Nocardioidaceae bacterium]|nr:recombinase family protein [Nocardioidaceae bacterium]
MPPIRAAIYARISSDDGSALGVGRQVQDCTREAERRGWTVAETFVDNDVSASTGRKRPEYERMVKALQGGEYAALVVWDVDRLTRTPAELEDFISLADVRSVALASVGGEIDLGTPQGRLTARIKGSVARHEVEQSSRRLRRKFLERAEQGKPHGQVAYGYQRQG